MKYDLLFVTHLPCFYKVNLYNAIAKNRNVFVIFIAEQSACRTSDFVSRQFDFDYEIINAGAFEDRSVFNSMTRLLMVIRKLDFNQVVVSGWDLFEYWFIVFLTSKHSNCLALESTILESHYRGIRGLIKKIFLSRIHKVYASGALHKALLDALNFKGIVRITKGVGLINKLVKNLNAKRTYGKRFLYLGRLSEEKNPEMVVDLFNALPSHQLIIAGDGGMKQALQARSNANIQYLGHIPNEAISNLFRQVDFLILPSFSEPWGLVVEEALYNGVPILVSSRCGASELIVEGVNGYIFDLANSGYLKALITQIDNKRYQSMLTHLKDFDIEKKDAYQVSVYQ